MRTIHHYSLTISLDTIGMPLLLVQAACSNLLNAFVFHSKIEYPGNTTTVNLENIAFV